MMIEIMLVAYFLNAREKTYFSNSTVTLFDQDGIRIRHGTSLCFLLTNSKYVFQSTKSNLNNFSIHHRKQLT